MNILINLFTDDISAEKIKEYSSVFKSFKVHHYQIKLEEMYPDILEAIISHIQQEDLFEIKNTTIIFQTNVADIAHFSANFYSEMIDGVILVQDNVTALTLIYDKFNWILEIAQIKSNKLRLNNVCVIDDEINDFYLEFIFFNRLINNVEPIESLSVPDRSKQDSDLNFITTIGEVSTNRSRENSINITNEKDYWLTLLDNNYGMKLVGIALSQSIKEHSKYLRALILVVQNLSLLTNNDNILEHLTRIITIEKIPLHKFVEYNFYRMKLGDRRALKTQYSFLREKYHTLNKGEVHALISNSVIYETKLNQESYFGLFQDRMFLMRQLVEYWRNRINIENPQRSNNKIAIFAGQLLDINHAPTQWAINYANTLKKYNSNLEIKIFVDDWANYSHDDTSWSNVFRSADSSCCSIIHTQYLHPEIEVHYSNSELSRHERIQQDVDAILKFQPHIIFKTGSRYSITTNLLYTHYPIVSQTLGGMEDSDYVDIFTGGYTEEIATKLYKDQGMYGINYLSHIVGIETPKSMQEKSRIQYGLENESLVIITVGNRLDTEISASFLNQMNAVLRESRTFQWVIIGSKNIPLIDDMCKKYLINGQIRYLEYEQYLFDFYKISDVYVNPFRKTGGNSAAIAMKAGLPIVTTDTTSDVGGFVGPSNCIAEENFSMELIKLLTDKSYYEEKSTEMLNIINNNFSFQKTYQDLQVMFNKACDIFQKRTTK